MAQHFLLSAAARTLSLRAIYKAGEEAAYETFRRMRWEDGKPVCPRCGHDEPYSIPTRRKYKCRLCYHQFSVTSGTIFASRKMAFVDLRIPEHSVSGSGDIRSAISTHPVTGSRRR